MTADTPPERRTLLWAMLAVATVALVAILLPFYGTLLWSVIIALMFAPMNSRLRRRLGGRRNLAALLTLLAVLLLGVMPMALLVNGLVQQANALYERLQSPENNPLAFWAGLTQAMPGWLRAALERLGVADFEGLQRQLRGTLAGASQALATQALKLGQNTLELAISLMLMLYISFFLIRDGDAIARTLQAAVPLSPTHQRELSRKFNSVVRATVRGNLVVAALQGALGGLAFWALDVEGALLWAVAMAVLALLPAVGAALVWAPAAGILLFQGETLQAVGLVLWGVLVIGLVDNVLRPVLVGKDTRMPDWLVLITTLGGIVVLGIHGFVLGPLFAAMFISVWQIVMLRVPRSYSP